MKNIDMRKKSGQILIELLLSIMIGGTLLVIATLAIVSLIRYNFESRISQAASFQAGAMMNLLEPLAESNWHALYDLTKGTSTSYYLLTSTSSAMPVQGEESVMLNDITAGLVGYWKFDEAGGTAAYDYSKKRNKGTLVGSPTRIASGNCVGGGCLGFDGLTQRITVVNQDGSLNFSAAGGYTVSGWINLDQYQPNGGASGCCGSRIINDISGDGGFDLRVWNNGSLNVYRPTTWCGVGTPAYSIPLNAWTHVAFTYSNQSAKLYINGSYITGINSCNFLDSAAAPFMNNMGGNHGLYGKMDDMRVYNRQLSSDEIKQLYENKILTRHFSIENVLRDAGGNISSTGTPDSSTQKVTIDVLTPEGKTVEYQNYLTRTSAQTYVQTDWSAGSGIAGPVTSTTNGFFTSSNVSYMLPSAMTLNSTTTSGSLESSTFDTQIAGGAALYNVFWQGSLPSGTLVRFQLAYSNSSTGPWNYVGTDGTGSTYFAPSAPNIPAVISNIHNYRYFRYKIFMSPSGAGDIPTVQDIIINWAK